MDQRRTESSLDRFLRLRAVRRAKNPLPPPAPVGWKDKLRWKLKIRKRSIILRAGIFGIEMYLGERCSLPMNISVNANRIGIRIYSLFRIVRGGTIRCTGFVKYYEILEEV